MQEELEEAQEVNTDLDKKVAKLDGLNKLTHKDLILSINTSSAIGSMAFGLVKNMKSQEFPKGNCKIISHYTKLGIVK